MKFSAALVALSATMALANPFAPAKSANNAKAAYISKLTRGAKVVRALEQEEEYQVDISSYSVKFGKCQFVKTYDDERAQQEDSDTVLSTKRFIIFRLCPSNSCSSCNYGYGEYMIDLETYLEATVGYQQELQEEMCKACEECGNWDDQQAADEEEQDDNAANRKLQQYNADCDTCYDDCLKIENLEANGFVDATNFLECQMIYDPDDDSKGALYAGPFCDGQGYKINIGVFTDENCEIQDTSKDLDDYLMSDDGVQMQLSHALLKTVYSSSSCVSCTAPSDEEENNGEDADNGEEKEVEVLEMCQQLYEASAKCEKAHSFDGGYSGYSEYYNQLANEEAVCDFITSIQAGSYDEYGEIHVYGANGTTGSPTTGGQKVALTLFIFGTAAVAVYAAMLHSKLTKGGAGGLSKQGGGAMA